MIRFSWLICFSIFCSASIVQAEWVQVTGKSKIQGNRYDMARDRARKDAMEQALYQSGTYIKSQQTLENGVLKKDEVSVLSEARIRKSVLEDEFISKGILNLVMSFDIEEIAACPESQAKNYKKKIAVLGFSVQSPEQLRLGGLKNIERALASSLNRSLQGQGKLIVHEHSELALHQDVINAPSRLTAQDTLSNAADYAKQTGAQFVVSGVVRDLSLEDPEAFSTSRWAKLKRWSGNANLNRRFAMELFVHDGYSGAIIWQRSFAVSAPWTKEINDMTGFGSAEFWNDEYGQAVAELVEGVSTLVSEQLECQPFITRISRIDNKTLHFDSGASSGVRPGDKFSLYRTFNYYDANMLKGTELSSAKTALTVSQVHPGFASGHVAVDPGRINIQEDDLLIAW